MITSLLLMNEPGLEMRLGLMAQLFDVTERGYRINLPSYSEIDEWYNGVTEVLGKMDLLHRDLSPLPGTECHLSIIESLIFHFPIVVAEHDVFFFHMLLVYYNFCRLLVLHQALREARRVCRDNSTGKPWYRNFVHKGIHVTSVWGREAVLAAEAVLVASLSRQENIGTAPDNVFAMISFAAVWLIMAKFAMFQNRTERLPVVSHGLLTKTIERLTQEAMAPDHVPVKCAQLIAASMKMLQTRTTGLVEENEDNKEDPEVDHTVSAEQRTSTRYSALDSGMFDAERQQPIEMPDVELHHQYEAAMNPESFLDGDFWSSFMNNLSTGSSGIFQVIFFHSSRLIASHPQAILTSFGLDLHLHRSGWTRA
jgi:hypothetical protein